MKKTFFLPGFTMVIVSLMTMSSFAQVSVGAKAGLNVSNLKGFDQFEDIETKALIGFHLGGFATFNLGPHFAIQPEVLFSTQGARLENANDDENLNLNYINIPVMFKFLTNSGFYVEAGPQLGFRVNQLDDKDWEDLDDEFKSSDASASFGLGFQPTKSPIGIGARYNIGLGKVAELQDLNDENVDIKSGVFQLSLYWRIFGGGDLKDSNKHAKLPKTVL